jgi:hypothetical protein
MLPSTMQGGPLERKHGCSETGDDEFEEMVRASKLVSLPLR